MEGEGRGSYAHESKTEAAEHMWCDFDRLEWSVGM